MSTIQYQVSTKNPHRHFIHFRGVFPTMGQSDLKVRLASWRPGRYEMGSFAKNVRSWKATTAQGVPLRFNKTASHQWVVNTMGHEQIIIEYEYYASELNAGSSFLDENQLYINPVNCFLFLPDFQELPYEVAFSLPSSYRIATGLKHSTGNALVAKNFDELVDCPLIAAQHLIHEVYESQGIKFNIWIQGGHAFDMERFKRDMKCFTDLQMDLFGSIPCNEYHFLYHFVPGYLRHGVEHSNSTVIAMGPKTDFQAEGLYNDLLGISCHELYHTWNIKCIRPVEMLPYDFAHANYARTGYVYEGVTTYYGDLLLWRCDLFSDAEWLKVVDEHLHDHYWNPGRFSLSVAESSIDTWLDGYSQGIPWRKVSIYNEGFLISMILDIRIMDYTDGRHSLDDVMLALYNRFGKMNLGYSEDDFWNIVEEYGGAQAGAIRRLSETACDYGVEINDALSRVGCVVIETPSAKWCEAWLGMIVDESSQKAEVQTVWPDSPADRAGLWRDDEIINVNGFLPYKNFQLQLQEYDEIELTYIRKGKVLTTKLRSAENPVITRTRVMERLDVNERQRSLFDCWKKRRRAGL
ncbi:MAG: M61 family metallopeptidase [Flavobacteriales bacterium]